MSCIESYTTPIREQLRHYVVNVSKTQHKPFLSKMCLQHVCMYVFVKWQNVAWYCPAAISTDVAEKHHLDGIICFPNTCMYQ